MMSIRDFFDSARMEPKAKVSANSCGSSGFSGSFLTRGTRGLGGSRGAISIGVVSSSSVPFNFFPLPRASLLSVSFLRFSFRFSLSVSGSLGSLSSDSSRMVPPSPPESSSSLSLSIGIILVDFGFARAVDPPALLKMSWLNQRAMRCSAFKSSPSSPTATRAVLEDDFEAPLRGLPSPSSPSSSSSPSPPSPDSSSASPLPGPSRRNCSASTSTVEDPVGPSCSRRNCARSSSLSLSSSSSSSLSLFLIAISSPAFWSRASWKAPSSPAQACITRCRRVSFFFFRIRCCIVRYLSSLRILRSWWSTARSTSSFAYLSSSSSELSSGSSSPLLDSPGLSMAVGSKYNSWFSKARMLLLLALKSSGWSCEDSLVLPKLIFRRNSCFFCRSMVFFASRRSSFRRLSTCSANSSSSFSSAACSSSLLSPPLALALDLTPSSSKSSSMAASTSCATAPFVTPVFVAWPVAAPPAASCSAFLAARSTFSCSRFIFMRHFNSFVRSVLPRTFRSAHSSRISSVVETCASRCSEPLAVRLIRWCVTRTSAGFGAET
mmetsp:Transcript_31474/g.90959  ORF Transcript_31474/g.90959 Transcript_31474/m.90959 type:complete len:549 (-) Transcript_31474:898-2544(-)